MWLPRSERKTADASGVSSNYNKPGEYCHSYFGFCVLFSGGGTIYASRAIAFVVDQHYRRSRRAPDRDDSAVFCVH